MYICVCAKLHWDFLGSNRALVSSHRTPEERVQLDAGFKLAISCSQMTSTCSDLTVRSLSCFHAFSQAHDFTAEHKSKKQ